MGAYLVTGSAGFIGSKVAEKLIFDGHRVVTIDNLSTGLKENISENVEFLRWFLGTVSSKEEGER